MTDCEIYTFYAYGYLPLDPDSNSKKPVKVASVDMAYARLRIKLLTLGQGCSKVLPSKSQLLDDASRVIYWDVRDPNYASIPAALVGDNILPSRPGATLGSELNNNPAVTLWGGGHSISPVTVLGSEFFDQSISEQGVTLLHELLHYATQDDDHNFDRDYGIVVPKDENESAALQNWLRNDCSNSNK